MEDEVEARMESFLRGVAGFVFAIEQQGCTNEILAMELHKISIPRTCLHL